MRCLALENIFVIFRGISPFNAQLEFIVNTNIAVRLDLFFFCLLCLISDKGKTPANKQTKRKHYTLGKTGKKEKLNKKKQNYHFGTNSK